MHGPEVYITDCRQQISFDSLSARGREVEYKVKGIAAGDEYLVIVNFRPVYSASQRVFARQPPNIADRSRYSHSGLSIIRLPE